MSEYVKQGGHGGQRPGKNDGLQSPNLKRIVWTAVVTGVYNDGKIRTLNAETICRREPVRGLLANPRGNLVTMRAAKDAPRCVVVQNSGRIVANTNPQPCQGCLLFQDTSCKVGVDRLLPGNKAMADEEEGSLFLGVSSDASWSRGRKLA